MPINPSKSKLRVAMNMKVCSGIEDILAENIIGRKVPCNTLVEHICQNFACISHPTHSPKKLAPFYHYIFVVWRCYFPFGRVSWDFDECVSTNVLQLVHIHRNIKLPFGGVISHLDVLVYKGGLCPPNPPRLAAGYSPRCSLRSQTYGSAGGSIVKSYTIKISKIKRG